MSENEPAAAIRPFELRLGKSGDPRAVRTRKALREAFLNLAEAGSLEQITPREIAAAAGVARGSFYLHYPSKQALLEELAHEAITEFYERGDDALEAGGSKAAALSNCRVIEKNRRLWKSLINGGAQEIIRDELFARGKRASDERSLAGDRLPIELGYTFATAVTMELISWWLRQEEGQYSAEFVAELMVGLIFDPIRAVSTSPNLKFS